MAISTRLARQVHYDVEFIRATLAVSAKPRRWCFSRTL